MKNTAISLARTALISALLLIISACSTQPNRSGVSQSGYTAELTPQELYLRGVFNWWGIVGAHQFHKGANNSRWEAKIELVADGQPYDFKLADTHWTPSQTCGAQSVVVAITPQQSVPLYCSGDAQNLRFTPADDGFYTFILIEKPVGFYSLIVERAS